MDRSVLNGYMVEVKKQDEAAFEGLFDACKKEVFGFLYVYTKNVKDTKSLLRKTFVKLRETAQKQQDGTDAFTFILKTAHAVAIEYLKRKIGDGTENAEVDADKETVKKGADEKPSVYDILNNNFEDTDRQILLLKGAYGYRNKEVAGILNIPVATVPWKYNNEIKSFKDMLVEAGYEGFDIESLFIAENAKTEIKLFKDITKTPIQQPANTSPEKTSKKNFFTNVQFISAAGCLALALLLLLIGNL